MLKTFGVVLGGIFAGAVAVEIVRAKCPATLDKFYAKVNDLAAGIKEGFKEGYCSVSKSAEAVEPAEAEA